jgi:hypothetical protein
MVGITEKSYPFSLCGINKGTIKFIDMADTLRKVIQGGYGDNNGSVLIVDETKAKHQKRGDWCKGKKLKPYIKDDVTYRGRYKRGEHVSWSNGQEMGNTRRGGKIENDNANRSLKKGVRQKAKIELSKELQELQIK